MQIAQQPAAATKVTSVSWPLVIFLATASGLGSFFWFASEGDFRGFFSGLKPQDWATVLSGVFAVLAFSGLLVSLVYQRSEIVSMQRQIFDQTAALARHAVALEAQNSEIREQTAAVLQQAQYYKSTLTMQRLNDIDAQIDDMEALIEEKLQDLLKKMRVKYQGSAISYLLSRDDAPLWLAHSIDASSLMANVQQKGRSDNEALIIFNTIISRCRAIKSAVDLTAEEDPNLRDRVELRFKDSDLKRIEAIFGAARKIVNRRNG